MIVNVESLNNWIKDDEDEHLEFKEAKYRFDFELTVKYCAALANEQGGKLVLGVTNSKPRKVVGTQAFRDLASTKFKIVDKLRIRIDATVLNHPDGRVIVFVVPSRSIGLPIQYKGAYWMRSGESLIPMTPDMLKRIFNESGPDFSSEICPKASIDDLDPKAIKYFRDLWIRKSGNQNLTNVSCKQLLQDCELLVDNQLSYAALILLGKQQSLGNFLAQSEVIYEYRSSEASIPYQQRLEYRQGFFAFENKLWDTINLRNEVQQFRDGFFVGHIPTFNEKVIREAILNAISHRDYRLSGSIFIQHYPRKLEIKSPGGFPSGITPENFLYRQNPRNRRISEVLARCGRVERSGQGIDLMFETCVRESKPLPDYSRSDDYEVAVLLRGDVQDPEFLRFLEQVGRETQITFSIEDLLLIDQIKNEQSISEVYKNRIPTLIDNGIIERTGRGKGTRYILSHRFYTHLGKKGVYTRRKGLDRETNKGFIFKHIQDNKKTGSKLQELHQVIPSKSRRQIQGLLQELKKEGQIYNSGTTNASRWYPSHPAD